MLASSRGPRAAANTPGRIWNPPLRSTVGAQPIPGGRNRPGDRNLALPATPVGADSISARFAAARGPAGGINPAPTNKMLCFGPTGGAAITRATVGRDAPSRRTPRRRNVPREGHGPPLQTVGNMAALRETANPAANRPPCRGRCLHRPGDPAPPPTPDFEIAAVRRAKSPALRNGENGAANRATATLRYPHPL